MNPYTNLPDYQYWRRAVSLVEPHNINLVVNPKFAISRGDLVSTAGSCFAQHISQRLASIGFNYFVPEDGGDLAPAIRARKGYGVFSARYGNIYTVRQLLHLFDEAFGSRSNSELFWQRADGRFVDPFRPTIEDDGFEDSVGVLASRLEHLGYVRRVFSESDVFVFTLGLTESWMAKKSGDVFPVAPGVVGGELIPEKYVFHNFTVSEVENDLREFNVKLRSINPRVRVLLTVSPVPLIATFEQKHVLVATTYSKSVLRVAAESAAR
jgi:hypothetical protein